MFSFETLGSTGLFLSAFISSTIAPGGSEAVLLYLLSQQTSTASELVLIATAGNTLGALTTCWLGLWTARKYPSKRFEGKHQQRSIAWIQRWGVLALLLSWLPLIGDALCFAAGWLRLPLVGSVLAIMLGKFLRYSAIAYTFLDLTR